MMEQLTFLQAEELLCSPTIGMMLPIQKTEQDCHLEHIQSLSQTETTVPLPHQLP